MDRDPTLEAVKVDRAARELSVATLGEARSGEAADRIAARLREAGQTAGPEACALLAGAENCDDCPHACPPPTPARFTIDHTDTVTTIARVTCPTAPRFWRWRDRPLPRLVPRTVRLPADEAEENEWKPQLAAAVLCGVAGIAAWALHETPYAPWAFLASYLAGAWFPALETWERLRDRILDVHFLMLAVAGGAAAIGAWAEGATLLFLFSFSGALEHYALGRTHREIRSLIRTAPKEATALSPEGHERRVLVEDVTAGMRLLIKPGDLFPVDAEVAHGTSAADEANLTGEAAPVDKGVGDTVLGGTLNLWGPLEVVVLRPAERSALQRIIHLINESQRLKAPSQRFTDRFGTGYTLGVLGLTVLVFLGWWLGLGRHPFLRTSAGNSAFYIAMTLLVVASPCALVLSIPSAILAAIAHGARHGILFRGGGAVEKLAEVDVVAMDKTGTLTTGELRVDQVESFPPGREDAVARLAFSLERLSTHPLARAITRHGKNRGLPVLPASGVESEAGAGLRATVEGREARVGRREFVTALVPTPPTAAPDGPPPGVSEVWVSRDDLFGRVLLRDDIRSQAREVVEQLRAAGLRTLALTGDRQSTGEHLQRELALDEVRAELKPDEKVAAISTLTREGHRVAMIGDGVNDAPALAIAHVGVAMGARGSDAALEQADIVLMHDRLENFLSAFRLSRRARGVIRQNLVLSLGTVVVLVLLAIPGAIPLTFGVLGHEGSTVLVVLNSLRLLFRADTPGGEASGVDAPEKRRPA